MQGVAHYLRQISTKAEWSAVRPINTCAYCEKDFDTTQWHKVLAVSMETGEFDSPQLLNVDCVARFCSNCVPVAGQE